MKTIAKVVVAACATSLLVINLPQALQRRDSSMSSTSEIAIGTAFVAVVMTIAAWDCALAFLVCMLVLCWIVASPSHADVKGDIISYLPLPLPLPPPQPPLMHLPQHAVKKSKHAMSIPFAYASSSRLYSTAVA